MLIVYPPKVGGSHFSVVVLAHLLRAGERVLFVSAYPMAAEALQQELGGAVRGIVSVESERAVTANASAPVILLPSGDGQLFLRALEILPDVQTRTLFVKNIEQFDDAVVVACLGRSNVILSGNLDRTRIRDRILATTFRTVVTFSQTRIPFSVPVPSLERYTGFLVHADGQGTVRLDLASSV